MDDTVRIRVVHRVQGGVPMSALLHNLNVAANCARMAGEDATANDTQMLIEIARLCLLDAYQLQMKEDQRAARTPRRVSHRSPAEARARAACAPQYRATSE